MWQIPTVQHRTVGVHVWSPHWQRTVRYVLRQVRIRALCTHSKPCDFIPNQNI